MPDSSEDCGTHLSLVNLLLAFCTYHPRFPHPLLDEGFDSDILLEWEFLNADDEQVSFDLIANNVDIDHALLFEAKAAAGEREAVERFSDQVRRHRAITSEQVRRSGISLGEGETSFGLAVVCIEGREGSTIRVLSEADSHAVLLVSLVKESGACCLGASEISRGTLLNEQLDAAVTFELDEALPIPDHFIPFDLNSSLVEVAAEILPVIQKYYLDPTDTGFTEAEITEETIPAWDLIQPDVQTGLATRVRRTLQGLSEALGDTGFVWDNPSRRWTFQQPGAERAGSTPPSLTRSVVEPLLDEWDLTIDQIDAFRLQPGAGAED